MYEEKRLANLILYKIWKTKSLIQADKMNIEKSQNKNKIIMK